MTLQELVVWGGAATPASIFALLWWLERGERRDERKRNDELMERTLAAVNAAALAVQGLKDLLTAGRRDP